MKIYSKSYYWNRVIRIAFVQILEAFGKGYKWFQIKLPWLSQARTVKGFICMTLKPSRGPMTEQIWLVAAKPRRLEIFALAENPIIKVLKVGDTNSVARIIWQKQQKRPCRAYKARRIKKQVRVSLQYFFFPFVFDQISCRRIFNRNSIIL